MAFFGLFGFIFMITMYFQLVRGYDTLKAGAATLPFAAIMGMLSPLAIVSCADSAPRSSWPAACC